MSDSSEDEKDEHALFNKRAGLKRNRPDSFSNFSSEDEVDASAENERIFSELRRILSERESLSAEVVNASIVTKSLLTLFKE